MTSANERPSHSPNGQIALVTGASSGIGRSLAHLVAADGYDVVLVARRASSLDELAQQLTERHGVRTHIHAVDLSEPGAAGQLVDALRSRGLAIDVLVNNAGVGMQGAFATLPLDRQLAMVALNVTALTTLTGLLLPDMIARRRGGILNVGSTAGFQPGPFMAVYYATKAYVDSFTEAIADELDGSGLRVTCLAPGPTVTEFADRAGATGTTLFSGDMMSADEVARLGYEAWKASRPLIVTGTRNKVRQLMVRVLPRRMVRKAVRGLNTRA